jgi:ribose transport system ATP-binding protein
MPTPTLPPAGLVLSGISKSFPGVNALTEVSLDVRAGEVHALVGENGAGKSTLMAVAAGALAPDQGTIAIGGRLLETASPSAARELGLAIVRQDPALLPDLTVAENMAVGVGIHRVGGLKAARTWAAEQLDVWQMNIDVRARAYEISVEQRFVVEIAKALALNPAVLLLDEPTEHFNAEESERLFERVRDLCSRGVAVVYISHRIPEVKSIADRITVLRDGMVRGTFAAQDVSESDIVALVVGRSLDVLFPDKEPSESSAPVLLEARGLSGGGLTGVDLSVRAGEIVGLAGVQGNGQQELIRALAGLHAAQGRLTVAGRDVNLGSPRAATGAGVAYVPSDRHGEALFMPLDVGENIVLENLDDFATAGVIRDGSADKVAQRQVASLAVKTPSLRTPVGSLSGGNQQKVVLARTLLSEPKVLLAEEPTQGVDAGARAEIYRILRGVSSQGSAVVVMSSDALELEGLCDRVAILSRGHIVKELSGDEVTEAAITSAALTSTSLRTRLTNAGRSLPRLRRWGRGDYAPSAVLAVLIVLLGLIVASRNPSYASQRNFSGLLLLLAPLVFLAMGQLVVMLGAGIDLSVGPLTGFLVVGASFWIIDAKGTGGTAVGLLLMLGIAVGVGLANGLLVQKLSINPVVATLAMFMALRGLSLTLRSTPGGSINENVTSAVETAIGPVPVALLIAVAVAIGLEWMLRRTRWGVELRAVGSRPEAAERLGVRVGRVRVMSYLICSLLVLPAGVLLMAQIGIGDGTAGVDYTLASITAVVLGGASIFGGRGAFIGAVMGAVLIQQTTNVTTFLRLSQPWQYWLIAILTLGSAIGYARLRTAGEYR